MIKLDDSELFFAEKSILNTRALALGYTESWVANWIEAIELGQECE